MDARETDLYTVPGAIFARRDAKLRRFIKASVVSAVLNGFNYY